MALIQNPQKWTNILIELIQQITNKFKDFQGFNMKCNFQGFQESYITTFAHRLQKKTNNLEKGFSRTFSEDR